MSCISLLLTPLIMTDKMDKYGSNPRQGSNSTSNSSLPRLNTQPDFLAVVLDINPYSWSTAPSQSTSTSTPPLKKALDDVRIFLNSHIAQQSGNGVAIWAAGIGKATLLHTTAPQAYLPTSVNLDDNASHLLSSTDTSNAPPDASTYQHFSTMDNRVFKGVKEMMEEMAELSYQMDEDEEDQQRDSGSEEEGRERNRDDPGGKRRRIEKRAPIGIVSAIAQALCHINRHVSPSSALNSNQSISIPTANNSNKNSAAGGSANKNDSSNVSGTKSRILVLSVTPDASAQYVPMMNSIFAAQKRDVTIDVLKLFGSDTVFLQQAAHLTKGVYFRLGSREEMLVTLMTTYLPSRSLRHLLQLPTNDEVDFRAACFCHKKVVDIGYVCSVCLSIFCEPVEACLTCRSKFPKRTITRFRNELTALGKTSSSG